jgi:hypothetical protein
VITSANGLFKDETEGGVFVDNQLMTNGGDK